MCSTPLRLKEFKMSRRKTDLGTTTSPQYTKSYANIRGADYSSDHSEVAENRAVSLLNMYRDYDSEHGAAIETIPGYRRLFDFGGHVHGMWGYSSSQDESQEEYMIVHAGTKLFAFKLAERDSGKYEECFGGLADRKSSAFLQNNKFYICDGSDIFVVYPNDGEIEGEDGEEPPTFKVVSLKEAAYIPITYLSGAAYEQRNMLTDEFINRDTAVAVERYNAKAEYWGYLNDLPYPDGNFNGFCNDFNVSYYYFNGGYEMITKMDRKRTLDELDATPIQNSYRTWGEESSETHGDITCELVEYLGIKRLIVKRKPVGGEHEKILKLVEDGVLEEYIFNSVLADMYTADIVIYEPCIELKKVTVGGIEIPEYKTAVADGGEKPDIFYMPVRERITSDGEKKWYISFIHIYSSTMTDLNTLEVDIYGVAEETKIRKVSAAVSPTGHTDYLNANKEYSGTSVEAILGCSLSATFDGRVFLTGNSKLPNTVFYSCRDLTGYNNPAYYGVYNYFNDGVDNSPNTALLATSSVLMVMKRSTLHGSSIYYHTAADGPDDVLPRIYPATPGVAGIGCEGAALNFLDDAVFISDRGLEGVSKETLNLERTIGHRSSNIDRKLRDHDPSKMSLCRWGGYLCIFTGDIGAYERMYLADSRALFQGVDGSVEYEWFYLEGICGYRNDHKRYKTVTYYPGIGYGFKVSDIPEAADISVDERSEYVDYSDLKRLEVEFKGLSFTVYYVEREGQKIICDSDGELEGGEVYPACVGYCANGVLYFGTTGGQICCFNTDMRGKYEDGYYVEPDRIHRSWYTFAGHRYTSALTLKSDNCGVPHLTKRTVRKTCVLKLKSMEGSAVNVLVKTDREPYEKVSDSLSNTIFNFDDVDFDNFSFATDPERIVAVKEKKKKWVEKQFRLESTGYMRPFGFYSLTYNYEIQGRVKK